MRTTLGALLFSLMASTLVAAQQPPIPVPDTPPVPDSPPATYAPIPDAGRGQPLSATPIVLYDRVDVEDRDNIPACAVPTIVSIVDPCNPGCCRYVEICVLPNCEPRIKVTRRGTHVKYDYGEFEVDIYSKKNCVVVNYDD